MKNLYRVQRVVIRIYILCEKYFMKVIFAVTMKLYLSLIINVFEIHPVRDRLKFYYFHFNVTVILRDVTNTHLIH